MPELVTTRGTKKSSAAVCKCQNTGKFEVRIDKIPLGIHPDTLLSAKFDEVLKIIPEEVYGKLDFEITTNTKEGGSVGRIYAARQAFCKAVLAYLSLYSDEYKKQEVKNAILAFDRFAIVADSRKREPKKYGGPGARARYQISYR
jgi:small subunit ribosomal protein S16e